MTSPLSRKKKSHKALLRVLLESKEHLVDHGLGYLNHRVLLLDRLLIRAESRLIRDENRLSRKTFDPRMVFDPKYGGSYNNYWSIYGKGEEKGQGSVPVGAAGVGVRVRSPVMSQSDLYKHQALLTKDTSPGYRLNNDDKMNKLKRNTINSNDVVRIEIPSLQQEEACIPKEKIKTLIALLILIFHLLLSLLSLALIHDRVPDRSYPRLPDVFFNYMPTADWGIQVTEILLLISAIVSISVMLMHKHRFIVFRRFFLILSLLYLMRSITICVTLLPLPMPPTYYCLPQENNTSLVTVAKRVIYLIPSFGLSMSGRLPFCGDCIYSGHTIALMTSYLIIREYSPRRMWPLHWASFVASLVGMVFLLVSQIHYTIDVIIAYWVTTRVFWIYHTLANHTILKNRTPNNLLSRVWWFRIFQYFEGNVDGPLPLVHDWPLPWPRWFLAKQLNHNRGMCLNTECAAHPIKTGNTH